MNFKNLLKHSLLVMAMGTLLTACSDDDNDSDENADVDTQGPLYLVKTTDWSTDEGTSFIFLSETLNEETVFDPEQAQLVMAGYHYATVNETGDGSDNAFYLAVDNTPRLQRYVVTEEGELELDGELDFTNQGITDARDALRSGKIYSSDKGYLIDSATMQVVVFNPSEMTFTKTIDLSEHAEENYPRRWSIFPVIDGERVVVPITFYESDWSPAALSKLVVVDTMTDTVSVDSSQQCGSVSASAVDAAGNVYFASSHDISVAYAVDPSSSFAPCIIRMESGANEWDDSYYVDMTSLTSNNRPAYGVLTGNGDTAYALVYSDAADVITADNVDDTAWQNVWEFNSISLGSEADSAIKVEGALPTNHRIKTGAFPNEDGGTTPWVHRISADWSESTIYDATDSLNWQVLTVVPGDLETIARIR